jgi:superfamily II DNA/RNA helicase
VVPTTPGEKFAHIHQVLDHYLPPAAEGGAIVYCATQRMTADVAAFLVEKGLAAAHFHAGLPPETKKSVQTRFIAGELRVIVATNAFGIELFLRGCREAKSEERPSVALANDCRLSSDDRIGAALVFQDSVLHLSLFARDTGEEMRGNFGSRFARMSHRRRFRSE